MPNRNITMFSPLGEVVEISPESDSCAFTTLINAGYRFYAQGVDATADSPMAAEGTTRTTSRNIRTTLFRELEATDLDSVRVAFPNQWHVSVIKDEADSRWHLEFNRRVEQAEPVNTCAMAPAEQEIPEQPPVIGDIVLAIGGETFQVHTGTSGAEYMAEALRRASGKVSMHVPRFSR